MEGKVSWSEEVEVEPLLHSGHDDERILFCRPLLICEGAVAFPYLFLDRPHNLAPSVFEVCMVDFNELLERAAFLFSPFPGVPLSASPNFWNLPLEGLQRMLFRTCANRDAYFCGGIDLVFVWVVDVFFFLEARPPPLIPFFEDNSPDTLSLPPFSNF